MPVNILLAITHLLPAIKMPSPARPSKVESTIFVPLVFCTRKPIQLLCPDTKLQPIMCCNPAASYNMIGYVPTGVVLPPKNSKSVATNQFSSLLVIVAPPPNPALEPPWSNKQL